MKLSSMRIKRSATGVLLAGLSSVALTLAFAGSAEAVARGGTVVGRGSTPTEAASNAIMQCDSKSASGSVRREGSTYVAVMTCN